MNAVEKLFLMVAITVGATACDSSDRDVSDSGATPPDYAVAVTSVEIINRDSGEVLVIEGLPIEGGELTVD